MFFRVFRKNDDVCTPPALVRELQRVYRIDFDPCPSPRPAWDGLEREWGERNFVNPPYSEIRKWLEKALREREKGRASFFLIPVRSSSKYWRELVFPYATGVRFIADKVVFVGYRHGLPLPLCVVEFEPPPALPCFVSGKSEADPPFPFFLI